MLTPDKNIKYLIFYILLLAYMGVSGQTNRSAENTNHYVEDILTKAEKNIGSDPDRVFLYLNVALKYKDGIDEKQLLRLYKIASIAYSIQDSNIIALDYAYKSMELQRKIDKSRLYVAYNNIGGIYMSLGDSLKAKQFWVKSLNNLKGSIKKGTIQEKNVEAYAPYNNLALLEIGDRNYMKALEMLNLYKSHSTRLKDTQSIVICYQNLADVYGRLKERDSSKFYLDRGIYLSKRINSPSNLAYLYYDRGYSYSMTENDSALYYLEEAYALSGNLNINDIRLSSARALARLYGQRNEYKKANEYLVLADPLLEQSISLQGKKRIELLELENKHKMQQQEALANGKKRESMFIFSLILLVPVSIIAFLMYMLQKTKARNREVEIKLLVQKMESKNKELTSSAIHVIQATEIIDATHKELNQLKADMPSNKMLAQIISDLKGGNQSFNKKEFEKLFIEIDDEFYRKLIRRYPTLTSNEIRLCAFAKMNLSTKEVSAITNQKSSSILVARSRLRKKIGLDENQNLTSFLKSL